MQYNNFTKFNLNIAGIESFGKNNNIVWAGINKNPNLYKVYEILENELVKIGIPKEDRVFFPHITFAREVILKNDLKEYSFCTLETVVKGISLMQNRKCDRGRCALVAFSVLLCNLETICPRIAYIEVWILTRKFPV